MRNSVFFVIAVVLFFGCRTNNNAKSTDDLKFAATLNPVDSAALKALKIGDPVRPEIWGAKSDFNTDCTWALNECAKWCIKQKGFVKIKLSDGFYRTKDTWIIGNKWADETLYYNNFYFDGSQPGVDVSEYAKSRWANIVSIEGTGQTGIYFDFDDLSKLKAGIIYSVQGDGRCARSIALYTAKISGIGLYGKGYIKNGALDFTIRQYNGSNTIGLIMAYNLHVTVEDVTFYGLRDGLVRNNSYFSEIKNIRFDYCDRGYFDWQSHSSKISTMIGSFCNKAFEIRSSQVVLNNIGTSFCPVSLHIGSGSNLFNGVYLESNNCGEAQIIIGDNPGDQYYKPGYSYYVDGTVINMVTIVANKLDKTTGVSLLMKENARRLYVNGGSIQSSNKLVTNANNKIYSQGVLGMVNSAFCTVLN